jgi:hypothetical protein
MTTTIREHDEEKNAATLSSRSSSSGLSMIENPYARKRPRPAISRKPLEGQEEDDDDEVLQQRIESTESAAAAAAFLPAEQPAEEFEYHDNKIDRNDDSDTSQEDEDAAPRTTSSAQNDFTGNHRNIKYSAGGDPSTSLPLWQRLPSETISFGAAEILTVPETIHRLLHDHPSLPTTAATMRPNNSSVRVTGVVQHRYVHGDGSVSLALIDPLAPLLMGKGAPMSQRHSRRRVPAMPILPSILKPSRPSVAAAAVPATADDATAISTTNCSTPLTPNPLLHPSPEAAAITATTATPAAVAASSSESNNKLKRVSMAASAVKAIKSAVSSILFQKRKTSHVKLVYRGKQQMQQQKNTTSSSASDSAGRRLSFATTGLLKPTPATAASTPALTRAGMVGSQKQPWWSEAGTTPGPSSSASSTTTTPLCTTTGTTSTVPSPLEALIEAVRNGNCIWVVMAVTANASIPVAVHDLVMVLGEIVEWAPGARNKHDTGSASATAAENDADDSNDDADRSLAAGDQQERDASTTAPGWCLAVSDVAAKLLRPHVLSNSSSSAPTKYIQARIVRNVNGTNVKLQTDTLLARRAYLKRQLSN